MQTDFGRKIAFVNINVNNPSEQALCQQYRIQYIPTTYLLNSNGEVVFSYVGVIGLKEMRAKLKALAEGN